MRQMLSLSKRPGAHRNIAGATTKAEGALDSAELDKVVAAGGSTTGSSNPVGD